MPICGFSVQEMFKELVGPLPDGMQAQTNEMIGYWAQHPESWHPIQLSKAPRLCQQRLFHGGRLDEP